MPEATKVTEPAAVPTTEAETIKQVKEVEKTVATEEKEAPVAGDKRKAEGDVEEVDEKK
jgi:hypothetical protein